MNSQHPQYQEILGRLRHLMVELLSCDPEFIVPDASLEDDLGIVLDDAFIFKFIKRLNMTFKIVLTPDDLEDVVTIHDVVEAILTELDLG